MYQLEFVKKQKRHPLILYEAANCAYKSVKRAT